MIILYSRISTEIIQKVKSPNDTTSASAPKDPLSRREERMKQSCPSTHLVYTAKIGSSTLRPPKLSHFYFCNIFGFSRPYIFSFFLCSQLQSEMPSAHSWKKFLDGISFTNSSYKVQLSTILWKFALIRIFMLIFLYYQDENEVTAVHLHTSPLISDETYTIMRSIT